MNYWNGRPSVRIWRVGTKRILGVSEQTDQNKGFCDLPSEIAGKLSWETDLFADFTVCPFTEEKPGEMQVVCVQSAAHMVVRKSAR